MRARGLVPALLAALAVRRLARSLAPYVGGGIACVAALFRALAQVRKLRLLRNAALGAAGAGLAAFAASKLNQRKWQRGKAKRVAVVGSGIAGAGAAWALNRAGIDVVVYEKKPRVGGNAKSMTWDVDGEPVETGLAVLAWPEKFFHNYNALVAELGVETEEHDIRFFVAERQADQSTQCVFAHGRPDWAPDAAMRADLAAWDRVVAFVTRVNAVFQPCSTASVFRMGFLNPLNLLPLRLLCRLFGLSDRFWQLVFVPVHTSTFLEVEMDTLPATMAEVLDQIVPFTSTPRMLTWKTHAYDTVVSMMSELPAGAVRTSCAVEAVAYASRGGDEQGGAFDVTVLDEDGVEEVFDSIIFACSAPAMASVLHGEASMTMAARPGGNPLNGLRNDLSLSGLKSGLLNWLEGALLRNTMYTTDRDKTFERGTAHAQAAAVLPAAFREEILSSYANYIEVDAENPRSLENSFVLSSWAPPMQLPHRRGRKPMLVSYNADAKLEGLPTEWVSTSREAHPCLTLLQLGASVAAWPLLQGSRKGRTYFCGSAVLPANGHELSFVSGLVAASKLGAPYPFPEAQAARDDFDRLRSMMLRFWT